MGKGIPASPSELKASSKRLASEAAQVNGDTELLLLFYSVECEMKARFLKAAKVPPGQTANTHLIKGEFGSDGHDLAKGCKSLNLPASIGKPPAFQMPGRTPSQANFARAHQLWRYGIAHTSNGNAKAWLQGVQNHLANNR